MGGFTVTNYALCTNGIMDETNDFNKSAPRLSINYKSEIKKMVFQIWLPGSDSADNVN